MTWRLEASGGKGSANLVVIEPVKDNDPASAITYVRIRVTPKGGHDHPTMPLYPEGMLYRDRNGVKYTIATAMVVESGDDDESSIWSYDYLAAIGAHQLSGIRP